MLVLSLVHLFQTVSCVVVCCHLTDKGSLRTACDCLKSDGQRGIGTHNLYGMTMTLPHKAKRRTVLKTIGAGVVGSAVLSGGVTAQGGHGKDGGNNYGNGNAIGAFLNEEAMLKESPVWDTGVADMTDQDEVEILFGGLTDVLLPIGPNGELVETQGPWDMDPRAVEVSPGTDVTWRWYNGPGAIDAHHLVSYFDPPYQSAFELPWEQDDHDGHEHPGGDDEFYIHEDLGDTYTYTFDDVGNHLYFCIPHGTPFSFQFPKLGEVTNLFGQRGAVIVSDD